jgi:flagellin-like protein
MKDEKVSLSRQLFPRNRDIQRSKKLRALSRRRRHAISELVATVLTIAITLIAGAAVFSFVNSQAGASEQQYGAAVGGTIDSIRERFVVVDMAFSQTTSCSGASCSVTIWIFNSGSVNLQLATVTLNGPGAQNMVFSNDVNAVPNCATAQSLVPSPAVSAINVAPGIETQLTLNLGACSGSSMNSGSAYSVIVLSTRGNTVTYYQEK